MSINGQGFSPERSHEPLNITSWRRAVVLLIKGKAEQVEHNGKYLYSISANRYPAASLCSFLIRKFSDPPHISTVTVTPVNTVVTLG